MRAVIRFERNLKEGIDLRHRSLAILRCLDGGGSTLGRVVDLPHLDRDGVIAGQAGVLRERQAHFLNQCFQRGPVLGVPEAACVAIKVSPRVDLHHPQFFQCPLLSHDAFRLNRRYPWGQGARAEVVSQGISRSPSGWP